MLHTIDELRQLQAMPLSVKIRLTQNRIREWVNEFGQDGVYVSFSGGKDSTVLLDIVRGLYPDVKAVFVDTGLEFPEIREFVRTFDNVDWLKPKMNFKEVIRTYGYPFTSKETAECVAGAKKYLEDLQKKGVIDGSKQPRYSYFFEKLTGQGEYVTDRSNEEEDAKLAAYLNEHMRDGTGGCNERLAKLLGWLTNDTENPVSHKRIKGTKSKYNQTKWKFLLYAPFNVDNRCCNVMKKEPAHRYGKETGRLPILGTLAVESRLRTQKWLQNGCNSFTGTKQTSNPMSFWTENDVLEYIYKNNLPICSVYGEVVPINDQISMFDDEPVQYKTTGATRTGCVFCGFGCHLEKESRFVKLKETHPALYDYIMKPVDQGGLGYKEIIDWLNENGNLKIKY